MANFKAVLALLNKRRNWVLLLIFVIVVISLIGSFFACKKTIEHYSAVNYRDRRRQ